ncbi:MAG: hypothetical protein COA47_03025 [Robiginitomaculum sp.]|nr:MAG: hypothetical protein COA47_03025 [Robiginitomaculum sp.]
MLQGTQEEIEGIETQLRSKKLVGPIPVSDRVLYTGNKPVFMGNYWLHGSKKMKKEKPIIQTEKICCVDYSAGKGQKLCAYRWSGEQTLSDDKWEWVYVT